MHKALLGLDLALYQLWRFVPQEAPAHHPHHHHEDEHAKRGQRRCAKHNPHQHQFVHNGTDSAPEPVAISIAGANE